MFTAFVFSGREDAASRLKTLSEAISSYSSDSSHGVFFVQSLTRLSADFECTGLCRRVVKAFPSNFDDMFDKVTDNTGHNELINIVRTM